MDSSQAGPSSRPARPQQALGEPFDSGYAVEQALQTRDPNALQQGARFSLSILD
jgi:hypothetical protein